MEIFKAYDIRGIYPEYINPEVAYRLGLAYAFFLKNDGQLKLPFEVVVGHDMRHSSPLLAESLIRGLNEQGIDVLDICLVATPAFYYTVSFGNFAAGVMITASHNPKEFNGFKLCGRRASPLGLGLGLEKVKQYFDSFDQNIPPLASRLGKTRTEENKNVAYVRQELSYLDTAKIKRISIAADPGNAMGAPVLDELFKRIDCIPIKINWELDGDMPAHQPDPIQLDTLEQLQTLMRNEQVDFGIATDGDSDRIVFLDEQAVVIPPHIVLGLVAEWLLQRNPGAKIGYDLRAGKVVKEIIERSGGIPVETRVGHSYIKKIMAEQHILFSGELSSHYYYQKNFNAESPLFTAAVLLLIRSERNLPFSTIWRSYSKYHHSGEINFEVEDKERILDALEKKYAEGKVSKLDGLKVEFNDWWFNVRASNTEPLLRLNLEADTVHLMKEKLQEVTNIIEAKATLLR